MLCPPNSPGDDYLREAENIQRAKASRIAKPTPLIQTGTPIPPTAISSLVKSRTKWAKATRRKRPPATLNAIFGIIRIRGTQYLIREELLEEFGVVSPELLRWFLECV